MNPNNGNGLWLKIGLALAPLILAGLVAWGAVRADVRNLQAAIETKANRETVDAQYAAILRELQQMRALIERRNP